MLFLPLKGVAAKGFERQQGIIYRCALRIAQQSNFRTGKVLPSPYGFMILHNENSDKDGP